MGGVGSSQTSDLSWFGSVRYGSVRFDFSSVQLGSVRLDFIRFDFDRFRPILGFIRFDFIRLGPIRMYLVWLDTSFNSDRFDPALALFCFVLFCIALFCVSVSLLKDGGITLDRAVALDSPVSLR